MLHQATVGKGPHKLTLLSGGSKGVRKGLPNGVNHKKFVKETGISHIRLDVDKRKAGLSANVLTTILDTISEIINNPESPNLKGTVTGVKIIRNKIRRTGIELALLGYRPLKTTYVEYPYIEKSGQIGIFAEDGKGNEVSVNKKVSSLPQIRRLLETAKKDLKKLRDAYEVQPIPIYVNFSEKDGLTLVIDVTKENFDPNNVEHYALLQTALVKAATNQAAKAA
jgi:hypothetical protein